MNKNQKKTLIVVGIVEAIILVFCLTVSIISMATIGGSAAENAKNGPFIGFLQNNPLVFFVAIVLPLFIILVVDAVYLIYYAAKKQSAHSDEEQEAPQAKIDAEKAKWREEVLAELRASEAKKDEKPQD